jgi:hypothetical protein
MSVRKLVAMQARQLRGFCSSHADFLSSPTGLRVREIFAPSEGRAVEGGDLISVHFTGRLDDGTLFDTSLDESLAGNQDEWKEGTTSAELKGWDRGIPVQFTVGGGEVIEGWDEGVPPSPSTAPPPCVRASPHVSYARHVHSSCGLRGTGDESWRQA